MIFVELTTHTSEWINLCKVSILKLSINNGTWFYLQLCLDSIILKDILRTVLEILQ